MDLFGFARAIGIFGACFIGLMFISAYFTGQFSFSDPSGNTQAWVFLFGVCLGIIAYATYLKRKH